MQRLPSTVTSLLLYFVRPYRVHMICMIFSGILWGVQNSLAPYLLKLIIDAITHYSGDKANIFNVIKIPMLLYLGLIFSEAINFRAVDWLRMKVMPSIRSDVTKTLFNYLQHQSFSYFQKNFAGNLANKISDISSNLLHIFNRIYESISILGAFIIAIIALLLVHPIFSVILLAWGLVFIIATSVFSAYIQQLSHIFSDSKSRLTGKVVDAIGNAFNIMLFAKARYELHLLDTSVKETMRKERKMQLAIIKLRAVQDISVIVLTAIMMVFLVYLYRYNKVTVGDFVFILSISVNIAQSIWHLTNQFVEFSQDLGKCSQALSIINVDHEIIDSEEAEELIVTEGKIEFKDVTFSYGGKRAIFENHNIIIEPNQKVGLVGLSGSGKTTFIRLILRLFDIDSGKILIDDQDIKDVTQESLRKNISMIPQDVSLFHRSIMENIRYGKTNASDAQVIDAAKKAHCHEFIEKLPNKYDTIVGERGARLSGGQRQRIAIARAILENSKILILDEATSALDSVTEQYIHGSLSYLMKNRTSLVIAHRLSTLREMDRIIVFDEKGKIVGDDNHENLMKNKKGLYAKFWRMQTEGFLPSK